MRSLYFLLPVLAALWAPTFGSITILPGAEPKRYIGIGPIMSRDEYWRQNAENEFHDFKGDILLSSHDRTTFALTDGLRASADSFVRGAIQAWGEHLHLVIRPEEVWFTILTQMNFYMNANAEKLRDVFVSHSGQEVIYIEDFTWELVLIQFQYEIQKRVKTPWLQEWIAPNFTTTTDTDRMTANVLMMGLTKAYFKFEGGIICGLPSVTLEGTQRDWELLLAKLDHLADFGEEPKAYATRLRPVLSRFVSTFKDPDGAATKRFWNSMVTAHENRVCGGPPFTISGWITGFHYWTDKGRAWARTPAQDGSGIKVTLDNVTYPAIDYRNLPVGYAKVPFIMRDFDRQERYPAQILAGTLGKRVSPGSAPGYVAALNRTGQTDPVAERGRTPPGADRDVHNTLQPLSGWVVYGPVDYNATIKWQGDLELEDLAASIKQNFNQSMCAAKA